MKTNYLVILTLILSFLGFSATADEKETEQTSDIWLKAKIVTTYALSEYLNPFTIDVNVSNGDVTLTGTVENAIQSDLAEEIAKGVQGVKKVNNKLDINPETKGDTERGSFMHYVEDANITARLKSKLLLDPNTHGLKIHVTTKNSVVSLEGELNSDIEADLVRQIARNTQGVTDIEDKLKVSKKQPAKK